MGLIERKDDGKSRSLVRSFAYGREDVPWRR